MAGKQEKEMLFVSYTVVNAQGEDCSLQEHVLLDVQAGKREKGNEERMTFTSVFK